MQGPLPVLLGVSLKQCKWDRMGVETDRDNEPPQISIELFGKSIQMCRCCY